MPTRRSGSIAASANWRRGCVSCKTIRSGNSPSWPGSDMAKLVVFGTGDIARLAHHYFATDSRHEVVAFTVDRAYVKGDSFRGLPLVPFEEVARRYAQMNRLRADKYRAAKQLGYQLASYVSSRCTYLAEDPPGDNCFVLE